MLRRFLRQWVGRRLSAGLLL